MSTVLAVISFPFWLIGLLILVSAIFNKITLTYDHWDKRKATPFQRLLFGMGASVLIFIAYFLTSF